MKFINFNHYFQKNYLLILPLIAFTFLFLFRLDYNTIASWDEGWYGSIAREIVRSNNWLILNWNGHPFYDHPPLGFYLMAISYKLLGISELSTRLPSAIAGILTIIFIYKLGCEVGKNKYIGFVSSLILGTSVWYLIRVRSGNLDALFVFFYTLVLYLSYKSSRNIKLLPIVTITFAALMLTKTLVGISALVPVTLLNSHHLKKVSRNYPYFILSLLLFFIVILPWYWVNYHQFPHFYYHHFVTVGSRNTSISSLTTLKPTQPLFYLHMGVRKWYYPWILALIYLLISRKFLKKEILIMLITNLIILYPFLTSEKTEIWHLIPVYIPLAVLTASGSYFLEIGRAHV